jgi:Fe-Mn family superoxide dismutase
MDRRDFLKLSAGAGLLALIQAVGFSCAERGAPDIQLPQLPYPPDALEPYISQRTVSVHHGRHHRGYVEKTVQLATGNRFAEMRLLEIVNASAGSAREIDLFHTAAQAWNHQFYWNSMTPGGGPPDGAMRDRIGQSFGSYERFADGFVETGVGLFGSGWLWLVQEAEGFGILATANAETPMIHGKRPLLCVDLWEHAYYLDYLERRGDYLQAVLDHLMNWSFAEENMRR